jgi:hypothetical protein
MRPTHVRRLACTILLLLVALDVRCARRPLYAGSSGPGPGQTGFHNDGKDLFLAVDVKAAKLAGPGNFLPLYFVIANREKAAVRIHRENLSVETPTGTVLPLASPEEFRHDYTRSRQDVAMAQGFLDAVAGQFPVPPHHWMELEFFLPKDSPTVPRTTPVDLRFADVARGYLYFRNPSAAPFPPGTYKLLVRPEGTDATFVVDFQPFEGP